MGNRVNAINSAKKRKLLEDGLNVRDRLIWNIGIDTGLRISDILSLKRATVKKKNFTVCEQKTGKKKTCKLSTNTMDLAISYMALNPANGKRFLFFNQRTGKPYTRQAIWKNYKKVATRLKLRHIATHTMRKSYAQDIAKQFGAAAATTALNHSSAQTTHNYLHQRR